MLHTTFWDASTLRRVRSPYNSARTWPPRIFENAEVHLILRHSVHVVGFFRIMVRCSVFHLTGQQPVALILLYISATGVAKSSGSRLMTCGCGSPSTRESVLFEFLRRSAVLSAEKCPSPPSHLGMPTSSDLARLP